MMTDDNYTSSVSNSYWERRKNSIYLRYVDYIVCAVGSDAHSLIDIGSRACEYFEWFDWIQDRVSLDIDQPYLGPSVRSIKADFFTWKPDKNYNVGLCLQVLEHIPDAKTFAEKLLRICDHLVVSVPYKWEAGTVRTHVHDPIDMEKFLSWFPHKPEWSVIATEPFSRKNGRRIVAYFDTKNPGSNRFRKTRKSARERIAQRADSMACGENSKLRSLNKRILRRRSGLHWRRLPLVTPHIDLLIDVGASTGSFDLYKAYPNTKILLIDALEENRSALEQISTQHDAEVIITALGANEEIAFFNVPVTGQNDQSSFLKRHGAYEEVETEARELHVQRLDNFNLMNKGKIGLKIDAEGYELEILKGSEKTLRSCVWVVCEVSLSRRFVDDPMFGGVYKFLTDRGFKFSDFIDVVRQGKGEARRMDAVFTR